MRRLAHADARPEDFLRPVALCEAAGLPTVAAICEVMGPDGHMLTGSAVERFALKWAIPMIAIDELAAHV